MEDVIRLVSIDDAKRHIRETSTVAATESEIESKLAAATAFVIRHCTAPDPTWDETTVPADVHTTILLHLTDLYADRGDDPSRELPIGTAAIRYLTASGYRDPVLA